MKPKIIKLNAADSSFLGKYDSGMDTRVFCDASDAPFTVYMPDATSAIDSIFRISKTDTSSNKVTIATIVSGQKILNEDTQELRVDGDLLILVSDGSNWW